MRVAVLGTGTMGRGMAQSLKRDGLDVTAWNRSIDKALPLADDGIDVRESVEDAVSDADVVLTMLFDADAVLQTVEPVLGNFPESAIWVQSSTVGIDGIRKIDELAARRGVTLIDAPVLGTKDPAAKGELVVLASGAAAAQDKVQPVLDAIGKKTLWLGETVGAASALKLAGNAWVLTLTAAVGQSLALAKSLGVDPATFLEAISGGPLDSPYAQLKGKAMLTGNLDPQFAVDNAAKDLGLIVAAADGSGVDAQVLQAVLAMYRLTSTAGSGGDDIAAVYTAFAAG